MGKDIHSPVDLPETEQEDCCCRMPDLEKQEKTSVISPPSNRRSSATAEDTPYDISFHPGRFALYSRPRQRQRWGEQQVLPRVNWGDLFFDLFYVAATYNVSLIIVDQPTAKGVLYALATFWPVMGVWTEKTHYDARFVYGDDLYHQIFQLAILVTLATAVLNIRPVSVMASTSESSMAVFSLAILIERVFSILRYVEVYWKGIGQPAMKTMALVQMRFLVVTATFYLAATVVAFLQMNSSRIYRRQLAAETAASPYDNAFTPTSNVPIWIVLAGFLSAGVLLTSQVMCFYPSAGKHKERSVPMNVGFALHRNGEWVMLMIGESVFSLLIVEVPNESSSFFTTFYCAVLTVILLQYLHFRSQPHSADQHALRRHKNAGIWWHNIQHVYSFVLVLLGAVFTFFLTDYGFEEGHYRALAAAGDGSSSYDSKFLRERAAILFSASLAIIFFCLDIMILLHIGYKESQVRCVCKQTKKTNVKGIMLLFARAGLLVFSATLFLWETRPENLSIIGVVLVLIQLMMRRLGTKYLSAQDFGHEHLSHDQQQGDDETGDATWPNVTHARAEAVDH